MPTTTSHRLKENNFWCEIRIIEIYSSLWESHLAARFALLFTLNILWIPKKLFVRKKIATLYTVNIHNNKLSHGIFRTAALKTFFKHLPPPQHFQENILLMSKYTNKVQGRVLLFFLRTWNQIGVAKLCKQRLTQD